MPHRRFPFPYLLMLMGAAISVIAFSIKGSAWGEAHLLSLMKGLGTGFFLTGSLLRFHKSKYADRNFENVTKPYIKAVVPLVSLYVLFMLFMDDMLVYAHQGFVRVVISIIPAVIILLYSLSIMRYVRDSDELQRQVELEAIAISAMLVSSGYVVAGCLSRANLIQMDTSVVMLWVFPLLCLGYGVIRLFLMRHYL